MPTFPSVSAPAAAGFSTQPPVSVPVATALSVPQDQAELAGKIRAWGHELGFAAVGIHRAEIGAAVPAFQAWLAAGYHGEMDYMARHAELRAHPEQLLPGTVSIITAALDYWPDAAPAGQVLATPEQAYVSRYALGRDYHKIMRNRLQKLGERIAASVAAQNADKTAAPLCYRAFSDSAPVLEVALARGSGIGWRGKHSLLLSRQGSWRFLGELYLSLPLPADPPVSSHCGQCSRCIDACPTQAIVAPYAVDARRCISYLTIELAGPIPVALRPLLGNRIYGCDDCQLACPWNRFARLGDPAFAVRHQLDRTALADLFAWTASEFEQKLAGSPIRRIGHERWLRNLAVALGNMGRNAGSVTSPVTDAAPVAAAIRALQTRQDDASALVREHVGWALAALQPRSGQTTWVGASSP